MAWYDTLIQSAGPPLAAGFAGGIEEDRLRRRNLADRVQAYTSLVPYQLGAYEAQKQIDQRYPTPARTRGPVPIGKDIQGILMPDGSIKPIGPANQAAPSVAQILGSTVERPSPTAPVSARQPGYGTGEEAMSGTVPTTERVAGERLLKLLYNIPEGHVGRYDVTDAGVKASFGPPPTSAAEKSATPHFQNVNGKTMMWDAAQKQLVPAPGAPEGTEKIPALPSIPDHVLYGVAEGTLPPQKLPDGTMLTKEGANSIINRQTTENKARQASALEVKTEKVDIPELARAVASGEMAPSQISGSFGIPVKAQVQSEVRKIYPKFNFMYAEANGRWLGSSTNQRTIAMIQGSLPRVNMLADQVDALPNKTFPAINQVMRQVSIQTGKPEYTNFDSNRNAIVQEINTALSGSATGSDLRVKIELENLQSSRSPEQLIGAIKNLREALLARLEPSMAPLYPPEVIQGTKTIEQYQTEVRKKYRGANTQQPGGGPPALSPAGRDKVSKMPPGATVDVGGTTYTREQLLGTPASQPGTLDWLGVR